MSEEGINVKQVSKVLFTLILLLLSGCSTSNSYIPPEEKIIAVAVQVAERKPIADQVRVPGQVFASEQTAVMSNMTGKVDQVFFQVGDEVKANEILFTIDATDIQNNIKVLEAQIEVADAAIRAANTSVSQAGGSQMQSQMLQAKNAAEQAKAAVNQAELSLTMAQTMYDTALKNCHDAESLYESGAITKVDVDQKQTATQNAEVTLDQARLALTQAKTGYELAVEGQKIVALAPSEALLKAQDVLNQATIQKDSLLVSLGIAREKLADTQIQSPIAGIISSRNIEPQTVLPATVTAFVVVQEKTVEVRANVTESLITRLNPGEMVSLSISAVDDEFLGVISALSPVAAASAFSVQIMVDNADRRLKPGMYAEVLFTKEKSESSVVLPRSAVLTESSLQIVYVAENGIAKKTEVTTGIENDSEIEITSGLTAGAFVIVKGQGFVRDGSPVRSEEYGGDVH